ncbi:hypothetical protein BDF20DRAFT_496195 [Mycotypha africana]|uniref:uncharacterized protein n=1 Tax=Mycotypha africana TaxID=64632 RepID=UPI0023017B09|nr:uncharacterized protein BDF20DRAFT_496195 [Mycotypha africana]KAI8979310.1 hypothetical protein BDF20DRAFT_496195 [Mycotypha africana]
MVEGLKTSLVQKMCQDLREGRTAPKAPFLSILNHDFQQSDIEIDNSSNALVTLNEVIITSKKLLRRDPKFAKIILENFEDMDEEAETIMILALIRESNNSDSEWKQFFEKASQSEIIVDEDQVEELREILLFGQIIF